MLTPTTGQLLPASKNNGTWEETPGQSGWLQPGAVTGLTNAETFKPSTALIGTAREEVRVENMETRENKEVKRRAF